MARQFVMSMCRDREGQLWAGTEGGGVQRYDPSAAPSHRWTQFTTADGLGDNNGYAIACDHQDRIWVGHLNHGVSVYNGRKWQCYEVVGGLSGPDTLSGPLGERIFCIKVCPTDGDVWIATSAGLSRYSEHFDAWSYYTRANGLPSDQAQSLAFDRFGNLYVGTQCDGIAMAEATSHYTTWHVAAGPPTMPITPFGQGLPTSQINDLLVANEGTVYAATPLGLAWSNDQGRTWKFLRGADWIDKVRGMDGNGRKPGVQKYAGFLLPEDYVTCLADGPAGSVWVGYREHGVQRISVTGRKPGAISVEGLTSLPNVTAFAGKSFTTPVAAGYGKGPPATELDDLKGSPRPDAPFPLFPEGAKADTIADLMKRGPAPQTIAGSHHIIPVAFLGDDWSTQGDWVGRYGRQYATLFAMSGAWDDTYDASDGYALSVGIGKHRAAKDDVRRWISDSNTKEKCALYSLRFGHRLQSSCDDHGEAYARGFEGPDLHFGVKVPEGTHRLSLYFYNNDGESGPNRLRDYVITVTASSSDPNKGAVAKARVREFHGGVYKRFFVTGPTSYEVVVHRNGSFNTVCSGLFIDRAAVRPPDDDYEPLLATGDTRYQPSSRLGRPNRLTPDVKSILNLIDSLKADPVRCAAAGQYVGALVGILRYSAERDLPSGVVEPVEWALPAWSTVDREQFSEAMRNAWAQFCIVNRRAHTNPN